MDAKSQELLDTLALAVQAGAYTIAEALQQAYRFGKCDGEIEMCEQVIVKEAA